MAHANSRERIKTASGFDLPINTAGIKNGAERDRTADLYVANVPLSQLSYCPILAISSQATPARLAHVAMSRYVSAGFRQGETFRSWPKEDVIAAKISAAPSTVINVGDSPNSISAQTLAMIGSPRITIPTRCALKCLSE